MSEFDERAKPLHLCLRCGQPFSLGATLSVEQDLLQNTKQEQSICWKCTQTGLFDQLPASVQRQVDELLYRPHFMAAIKLLKETLGLHLNEATALFHWRHEILSALYPHRFATDHGDDQTLF
jgi:hypothetical protein